MIDLHEVFCSPACLSEAVFTFVLVGHYWSGTAVSRMCVCAALLYIHFVQCRRHPEFRPQPLPTGRENPKDDVSGTLNNNGIFPWNKLKPNHHQYSAQFWPTFYYCCTYACL